MSGRAYLDACARQGIRLDLAPMRALVAALGHPERGLPCVLVGGTNGKGSVVAYVEAALRASGHRTGRFTSPALVRVEEQIALDGRPIEARDLDQALERVRAGAEAAGLAPSPFEALTAAAFVHFRAARVDVAVVEVGLGGADDATNVLAPSCSAIVSVALDHEALLGGSLASIASAKAGVMRPGRVCVLGALPPAARAVIDAQARTVGARVCDALAEVRLDERETGLEARTPSGLYTGLRALPGAHQRDNLRVALRLLEAADDAGLRVDFAALASALAGVDWPGRLQRVEGRPPLLLDGAHNPAAAQALAAHLRDQGAHVLLFGAMRDKHVEGLAEALFPPAAGVVLTRADGSARAARPEELRARGGPAARVALLEDDPLRALELARALALAHGPATQVVVAGSLALVGGVLARLQAERESTT